MASTRMTFGEHLRQFALSIDFIDSNHYELLQQDITKYLEIQLDATQVALFEPWQVDDRDGMSTVWSYPTFRVHQTLRDKENCYRRQLALSIGEMRNLWVVSESQKRLSPGNKGVDLWGESEDRDLPPFYVSPQGKPSRTSIVMITRDSQGRCNGALLIEVRKQVRPTRVLRREMQLLADSVGLLHATDLATREQREGTNKAIATLADLLRQLELDTGPKPLLFIAYSDRAPQDVMKAIDEVLKKFEQYIFARHWGEMHQPGNINMQLVEEIRRAQYGICYLSEGTSDNEPSDSEIPTYRDNPNVLVEAGMLHMVTTATTSSGTGWIPIREVDSPSVPFDLENQRMVLVHRDDNGGLDTKAFMEDLTAKLAFLLDPEKISGASREAQDDGVTVEPRPD